MVRALALVLALALVTSGIAAQPAPGDSRSPIDERPSVKDASELLRLFSNRDVLRELHTGLSRTSLEIVDVTRDADRAFVYLGGFIEHEPVVMQIEVVTRGDPPAVTYVKQAASFVPKWSRPAR